MKKKNSNNKKLVSAAGMFLLSAAMLGSATYAWFTMNKEVTVTGMELKTKVGSNLLVCDTNVEADYAEDLVQNRKALLEPVSTTNAVDGNFFYTVNAAADGHWLGETGTIFQYAEAAATTNSTSTGLGKAGYDAQFNTKYGVTPAATDFETAYGYADYVFYLKAVGEAADSNIRLTECNLIYDNAALGSGDYAWRVAIFAEELNQTSGTGDTSEAVTDSASNLVSILDIDGSSLNWTADNAVSSTAGVKSAVTNASSAVTFGDIDAGVTKYYKVVARVYLEGEDKSCTSATYAALQDKIWELGLQFELNQGTAVTTIASATDNDTGAIMAPAQQNNGD